ncbi:MAG: hypothetical protein LBC70_10370 [Chitinispirillales bacterium]|nr:hypothetical protein [Chitinispirillales bacterium]
MIILSLAASGVAWETGFSIVPVDDPDVLGADTAGGALPPPRGDVGDIDGVNDDVNDGGAPDIALDPAPAEPEPVPAVRQPSTREELRRMSREELFRLAFGRAAPERPRNLILVLIAEGRLIGNSEVVYEEDFSSFRFVSPDFSRFLDTLLLPAARSAAGDSAGYFSSAVLQAAGFTVVADEFVYELRVLVPPESKVVSHMNLNRRGGWAGWASGGEFVKPAFVSFYLNYLLSDMFIYTRSKYEIMGMEFESGTYSRTPASINFNGALVVSGWVLDGSASLREPAPGTPLTWDAYRRGNVVLSRDFVSRYSKFSAGDISLNVGGTVGGARYEYNKRFFRNNPHDEQSKVAFFMPRSGQIEVYMDGFYRQRFHLPAGHHEVSGFGGEPGRNTVRLVLRMDDGSVEEVPFEYILGNPRNIGRGETRYSLAGGFRREHAPSPACFEYIIEDPAVSFDWMYGLSRRLSVGLRGGASQHNNLGTAQFLWDLGTLGWTDVRITANYMPGAPNPYGERADISYTPNVARGIKRLNRAVWGNLDGGPLPDIGLSLRGYYQGAMYNPSVFGEQLPPNAVIAGASGNLGFGFLNGSISANGGIDFFRETEENTDNYHPTGYNYGVRLSQSIMTIPISMGAGVNVAGGVRSPYFSVNMTHRFGVGAGLSGNIRKHQFSASADIGTGMAYAPLVLRPIEYPDSVLANPDFDGPWYELVPDERVQINVGGGANFGWLWRSGGSGAGSHSYSANVRVPDIFNPSIPGLNANFRQLYNRGELTGHYNLMNTNTSFLSLQTHMASAMLSGSFMFADGLWAFGRPVSGGFMLIDAKHSLQGANVHVNRSHHNKQEMSRNGWLGAAYHNQVGAYSPTQVMLTLTDVPWGAALQNNRFYAYGGPGQGYALRLGSKSGVLLLTRITSGGRPVSYAYVTIEPESDRAAPRATFTGGDGTLQMDAMTPGARYRIKFSQASGLRDITIEIPRGSDLILELGDIEVERDL